MGGSLFERLQCCGFVAEQLMAAALAADPPAAIPPQERPPVPPLLRIEGISHRFGKRSSAEVDQPILQELHLELAMAEITVLLGPSGCGKSTLLNLAAGLVELQRGRVLIDGLPSQGPHPRVGVVFQQPALLPWLNVYQNVGFGLSLKHSEPLSRRQRHDRILEALDLVGLGAHAAKAPAQLSGGMGQRVALARVLVRRPRLLLLDEPFSALDAVTRTDMQGLLRSIVARIGTGVLIVTHDVDEALALGDRILLMRSQPGQIHSQWTGVRALDDRERLDLRQDILRQLSDILKP
jgi:NitT/TauT family transport system ATP-binding protein